MRKGKDSKRSAEEAKTKSSAPVLARSALNKNKVGQELPKCFDCGKPHQVMHHANYQFPLYVIFLCKACHNTRHTSDERLSRKGLHRIDESTGTVVAVSETAIPIATSPLFMPRAKGYPQKTKPYRDYLKDPSTPYLEPQIAAERFGFTKTAIGQMFLRDRALYKLHRDKIVAMKAQKLADKEKERVARDEWISVAEWAESYGKSRERGRQIIGRVDESQKTVISQNTLVKRGTPWPSLKSIGRPRKYF